MSDSALPAAARPPCPTTATATLGEATSAVQHRHPQLRHQQPQPQLHPHRPITAFGGFGLSNTGSKTSRFNTGLQNVGIANNGHLNIGLGNIGTGNSGLPLSILQTLASATTAPSTKAFQHRNHNLGIGLTGDHLIGIGPCTSATAPPPQPPKR